MNTTHFNDFLAEAVKTDPGSDTGLDCEELFGSTPAPGRLKERLFGVQSSLTSAAELPAL
jgi:hypothetical protein